MAGNNRSGRKKKPTNLKVINGTARKDRLPKNEPKPESLEPKKERWLLQEARKQWNQYAKELVELGLLTEADGVMFSALWQEYGWYIINQKIAKDHYETHKTTSYKTANGERKPLPQFALSNKHLKNVISLCADFGLSPSARSGISVPKPKGKNNASEFF